MSLLQMIDVVLAASLSGVIGHKIGYRKGKEGRGRDAAVQACMARHPAGGSRPHLKVLK